MILRTFCPFFVFLYVKFLCLPERRLVIGYIYKKEDCDCRCDVCRIAESMELFEYAPGVRDANNLGAWWLENKMDCSLPYEIDEFFDYEGYGESIAENNDGEFAEGLGFVCMEEGYPLEDILQDMIRAWAECERKSLKNGKIYGIIRYRQIGI